MNLPRSVSCGKEGQRVKNKLTKNLGWKIVSLLASVVIWILVTAINNPSVTQTYYNIPVELKNTSLITDAGQVYDVLDNTNVIPRVTIKAPHSVISEIEDEDIIAYADVEELNDYGKTIPIRLSTKNNFDQVNSIKGSVETVKLNIENKKTKTLSLYTDIQGKVGEGYVVSEVKTDQNRIGITGAESKIDSIVLARAEVDISGCTSDIGTSAEVKLYDAEGHQVSNDKITQNIRNVGVNVTILETKEIPVSFSVEKNAAPGYSSTGVIEANKPTVLLGGKSAILNNINEIVIPSSVIDISEQKGTFTTQVNIRNYIPDGLSVVEGTDCIFDVTVYIEAQISKRIALETDDIAIRNVPEGFSATIGIEEGTVLEVIGLPVDVNILTAKNVGANVDVTRWMKEQNMADIHEGFYSVPVYFGLSEDVSVLDPIQATLHIVKKEN